MPHKLLLADDSITIQRVIELTFADEDVQVRSVGDGKKAIESIQSERPDIVLADVGMPERDGYDVAEFIKRNPQLANIPVLLLTGAFEPIDETRARAVGCDGVLVKPFEPQMVINRVKDLLAGRRSGGLWGAKPAPTAQEPGPVSVEQPASSQPSATAASSTSASLEEYFDRLDAAFASVEAATEARAPASAIPPTASPGAAPTGSTPAAPSGLFLDDLPGWDPDLTGDPHRAADADTGPIEAFPVETAPVPRPAAIPVTAAPVAASHVPEAVPPVAPAQAHERPAAPMPSASSAPSAGVFAPHPVSEPRVSVPAAQPVDRPAPTPHSPAVAAASSAVATSPGIAASPATAAVPSLPEAFAALLSAEQGRRVSPSTIAAATISDEAMDEVVSRVIARMTDRVVREAVIDVAERLVREEIGRIKGGQ